MHETVSRLLMDPSNFTGRTRDNLDQIHVNPAAKVLSKARIQQKKRRKSNSESNKT